MKTIFIDNVNGSANNSGEDPNNPTTANFELGCKVNKFEISKTMPKPVFATVMKGHWIADLTYRTVEKVVNDFKEHHEK